MNNVGTGFYNYMPEERRRLLYEKELKKHNYRKAALLQVATTDLVKDLTYYIYNGCLGIEHPDYYACPIIGIFDGRLIDGAPLFRDIHQEWDSTLHRVLDSWAYDPAIYNFHLNRRLP